MATRCTIEKGPGQSNWEKRFFDPILRSQFPILIHVKSQNDETDFFHSYRRFIASMDKNVFELPIVLNTIGWEGGSGNNWNFTGWILGEGRIRVRGVYSTETGKGWVVFETAEEVERREVLKAVDTITQFFATKGYGFYDLRSTGDFFERVCRGLNLTTEQYEDMKRQGII